MKVVILGLLGLFSLTLFASTNTPVHTILNNRDSDVFIYKERVAVYEDSLGKMTFDQLFKHRYDLFKLSTQRNLLNENKETTYWLYFRLLNQSEKSNFRLELYDFDIDEITLFIPMEGNGVKIEETGFLSPFSTRKIFHKNPGFDIELANGDSIDVFLKIKSQQSNILKPVVRHYQSFIAYGLKEYLILGVFYGLVLLILIYNLIYFLILRVSHYLYYVLYGGFLLIYLLTQNGMGFQFLWPQHPEINPYIDAVSLSLSIVFLLLFCTSYLQLKTKYPLVYHIAIGAIVANFLLFFTQLFVEASWFFNSIDFLFFQLCFAFGIVAYWGNYKKIKWFLIAFIVFNTSVFISMGESFDFFTSSVFTVYALNIGLLLQFVFLSIGIAESIRDSDKEKNQVLSEILALREKNESLRLTELKQQMNPHFIFNALNSIQSRILTDKKDEASKFLVSFSKLIRKNLEISDVEKICLDEELKNIRLYLEIENMRLGDSFTYEFEIEDDLDLEAVNIPTFIIQPLVENAIWHGLMPLETRKELKISVSLEASFLKVLVKDNGVGRKESEKKRERELHNSKGLKLINERLELISKISKTHNRLEFFDIKTENDSGTEALLTIEI